MTGSHALLPPRGRSSRLSRARRLGSVALAVLSVPALGAECGMTEAFSQRDASRSGGYTSVWSDAPGSALFFVERLNANTDGTKRSYSVDDFWGSTRAVNNLCNAMSDACGGLTSEQLRQRRLLTQRARQEGWPADLLQKTKIAPSIIAFKGGKPCPEVDGFLVSATALYDREVPDVCDLRRYVDSLVTPAIVLPGRGNRQVPSEFEKRNAKIGDLVVAMAPGATTPVYAVVGDLGPASELGEGSLALNGRLLGRTAPPANYREVRGQDEYRGRGWVVPRALVLIFPATRNADRPFMTPDRIDPAAAAAFASWGGVERLQACASAYAQP
jgi:hypothetical protein